MSQKKLIEIKSLVEGAEASIKQAKKILAQLVGDEDRSLMKKAEIQGDVRVETAGQVIEGVFDGQAMIGPDGKQYSVPANYASKSKLVEGDLLKLTIDGRGNFIYKQIGPIERSRLKGTLTQDENIEEWRVLADNKAYKVLLASVTYFKGKSGDEVVIMVPRDKSSTWAAIENIIKKSEVPAEIRSNNQNDLSKALESPLVPQTESEQLKNTIEQEQVETKTVPEEIENHTEDNALQPLGSSETPAKQGASSVPSNEFSLGEEDEFERI